MIETAARPPAAVADAALRSTIYRALAIGWRYPDREAFEAYQSGQYLEELMEFAAALPHLSDLAARETATAGQMRRGLADVPFEAFEVAYVAAFDSGFPEPPCPPYEGLYNDNMERAAVMLEVSEFYRHFGLTMSQAEFGRELPDYLCAELEFLHFLTFKEAQAGQEGTGDLLNGYRLAQKDFLERHLAVWFPKFSQKVQQEAGLPFFPDLARITLAFINAELELMRTLASAETGPQPEGGEAAA